MRWRSAHGFSARGQSQQLLHTCDQTLPAEQKWFMAPLWQLLRLHFEDHYSAQSFALKAASRRGSLTVKEVELLLYNNNSSADDDKSALMWGDFQQLVRLPQLRLPPTEFRNQVLDEEWKAQRLLEPDFWSLTFSWDASWNKRVCFLFLSDFWESEKTHNQKIKTAQMWLCRCLIVAVVSAQLIPEFVPHLRVQWSGVEWSRCPLNSWKTWR